MNSRAGGSVGVPDGGLPGIVGQIQTLAQGSVWISSRFRRISSGEILLREGEPNDCLFVLLEGLVELLKRRAEGGAEESVSLHGPGELLGVNSFATKETSFCSARVVDSGQCLRLSGEDLENLRTGNSELHSLIEQLVVGNLASRYRSAVSLHLELKEANRRIRQTTEMLVQHEKMAVLGELVAGIAHELNNPAAAIFRQREFLASSVQSILARAQALDDWKKFWDAGEQSSGGFVSREQFERITAAAPFLPRDIARRLAALPQELHSGMLNPSKNKLSERGEVALEVFEVSHFLKLQFLGLQQITHLVGGLKSYARPQGGVPQTNSLKESLESVLSLCSNLLKEHPVQVYVEESLEVLAAPGDLHQIWTNLIKNACEAMQPGKPLEICGASVESGRKVEVRIVDHGAGVAEEVREHLFDLNFTTKTGSENFGLGLGLSITRGLVKKMGGEIFFEDTPGGGATFVVLLPSAPGRDAR